MSTPTAPASNPELIDRFTGRTFVISGLIFILLAIGVSLNLTDGFDRSLVLEWNPENSLGSRQEAARDITTMGGYLYLTIFVTVFCFYLKASGRPATMWYVILTVLNAYVCQTVLKQFFDRPRPKGVLHLSYVESASFPSGHAMMSAVTYLTVALLLADFAARRKHAYYLLILAAVLSGSIGISRVYLGVHYPTDVLAGWAVGICWACGSWLLAGRLTSREIIPPIRFSQLRNADSD